MKVISTAPRLANVKNPATAQEIVFTKIFRHPHCSLSLQSFDVLGDLAAIYNLVADLMVPPYVYPDESRFVRSYMILLDQSIPVCEVDICSALQDAVSDHIKAQTGDHMVRLLPASSRRIHRRLFTRVLQTCLEYFSSAPDVRRIFIECDIENTWQQQLLLKAGFRLKEKISHEYKTTNLYYFSTTRKFRG